MGVFWEFVKEGTLLLDVNVNFTIQFTKIPLGDVTITGHAKGTFCIPCDKTNIRFFSDVIPATPIKSLYRLLR